jgi:hypothetical protein
MSSICEPCAAAEVSYLEAEAINIQSALQSA